MFRSAVRPFRGVKVERVYELKKEEEKVILAWAVLEVLRVVRMSCTRD